MTQNKWMKNLLVGGLSLAMIAGGTSGALAHGKGKGHEKIKHEFSFKGKQKVEVKITFSDLERFPWAQHNIASLASQRIFDGYEDGTFKPERSVSRLEAIVTAVRLMGLREEAESEEAMKTELNFKDANQVYRKYPNAVGYIATALENDLFIETEDKLHLEKPANRLWTTILLVKAMGLEEEAKASMNDPLDFKDEDDIPAGARGYVAVAVENGIIYGYPNGKFQPNKPVNRAEIAAFLDRASRQLPDFGDNMTQRGTLAAQSEDGVLVIATKDGDALELSLDPNAFVFRDGEKVSAEDLEMGDDLFIHLYNGVIVFVEVLNADEQDEHGEDEDEDRDEEHDEDRDDDENEDGEEGDKDDDEAAFVLGTVTGSVYDNDQIMLMVDGKKQSYTLHSEVSVKMEGEKIGLEDLQAGDIVLASVHDQQVRQLHVIYRAQQEQFEVSGYLQGYTLNSEGELATILIRDELDADSQISIYPVGKQVSIHGDASKLIENQSISLKGSQQTVHHITIL
ncbi:S-layer homology domain-containing protein [Marinicrinis sediminis]|uniref:S-layer homology domain-containing protein n=1 Tax=Marinicrinis sediminis TaxID=1652465 RepID=A0ABW5R6F7_9BACL